MLYYKLIDGDKFIGVGTSIELRKYQKKHDILLACYEDEAQYIECNGNIYRALWMVPEDVKLNDVKIVDVIEVEKSEYDILNSAIKFNKEIIIEDETVVEEVVEDDMTVDYVRALKINELKKECNIAITAGFDVVLSDECSHHFSLSIQDQLNLITAQQMVVEGVDTIAYHADGELCKYYSPYDMTIIIDRANSFKTYHIAYFNALKAYINSLNNMNKISSIKYGDLLPSKYQTDVYSELKNELGL